MNSRSDLLTDLLTEYANDWPVLMCEAESAQHSFNVEKIGDQPPPAFSELRWSKADGSAWTGPLKGIPAVFLGASIMPCATSPYPLDGREGAVYWRIAISLNTIFESFENGDFVVFYCRSPNYRETTPYDPISYVEISRTYQVNLVIASKKESEYIEGHPDLLRLDTDQENPFLYQAPDGQWCTNQYEALNYKIDIKYTVNLVLLKDFRLRDHHGKLLSGIYWSSAKKTLTRRRVTQVADQGMEDSSGLTRDELAMSALIRWSNEWKAAYRLKSVACSL